MRYRREVRGRKVDLRGLGASLKWCVLGECMVRGLSLALPLFLK